MPKKRVPPTRKCEQCGVPYHPRKSTCPQCGVANPTAGPRKKAAKKKVARKKTAKTPGVVAVDPLDAAVAFAKSVGGFNNAKAAMEQIEQIRGL